MTKPEIRILIADDHPIVRKGLRDVIAEEPAITIVAETEDGETALECIAELRPQVAVLDVDMPGRNGFEVARAIREERLGVAVIFLTMHKDERFFNGALDVGVKGYVLKDGAISEIVHAIKSVAAGGSYITPLLSGYLLNRSHRAAARETRHAGVASLTESERRILRLIAEYKTSQEIADELFISSRTVERHRANIASKLDLKGAHALMHFAVEHRAEL